MAERCYLAVDLGAESGRVVAGLFDGQQVRLEELHRFSNGAVNIGGTLRWDVLRLWSDIQNGLTNAAAKFGSAIASVGVDTWGVDYVLMTKTNEMLGAPWHYRDARSNGMLNHAFTQVPRSEIFAATGLQFMEINTLYQLLAMRQTNPDLMRMADVFLMMPDYLSNSRTRPPRNASMRLVGRGRSTCSTSWRFRPTSSQRLSRPVPNWACCERKSLAAQTWDAFPSSPRRLTTLEAQSRRCRLRIPVRLTGPTSVRERGR